MFVTEIIILCGWKDAVSFICMTLFEWSYAAGTNQEWLAAFPSSLIFFGVCFWLGDDYWHVVGVFCSVWQGIGVGTSSESHHPCLTVHSSLYLSVFLVCTSCRHGLENETITNSMGTILCVSSLNSWCLSKFLVLIRAVVNAIDISLHCSVKYSSQGHYAPPFLQGQ